VPAINPGQQGFLLVVVVVVAVVDSWYIIIVSERHISPYMRAVDLPTRGRQADNEDAAAAAILITPPLPQPQRAIRLVK